MFNYPKFNCNMKLFLQNIPRKVAEGCVTMSRGTEVNIIDVDNGNWYGSELHSAK